MIIHYRQLPRRSIRNNFRRSLLPEEQLPDCRRRLAEVARARTISARLLVLACKTLLEDSPAHCRRHGGLRLTSTKIVDNLRTHHALHEWRLAEREERRHTAVPDRGRRHGLVEGILLLQGRNFRWVRARHDRAAAGFWY